MVWYEKFGWKENPFSIDPTPDSLVINDVRDKLREYIDSDLIVNLYGNSGAGKSTILNWFRKNLTGKYHPVYINFSTATDYTPQNTEEKNRQFYGFLKRLENEAFRSRFDPITQLIFRKPLIERLESVFKDRTLVLLLDEAHDVKDERISSYIRTLNDDVKCATVITSIKPLSEIESFKESFRIARVANYIMIRKINLDEAKTMLTERIEKAGGSGTKPFDDQALARMVELENYSPRDILALAAAILMKLANEHKEVSNLKIDSDIIDSVAIQKVPTIERKDPPVIQPVALTSQSVPNLVDTAVDAVEPGDSALINKLSETQRKIVMSLKNGAKTADELSSELGVSQNAIFTELYRLSLKRDQEMMRKKGITKPVILRSTDKPHKYSLSAEWKLGLVRE